MQPDISEFSYGFALTNEMVGWAELTAAPIFPSLVEEGRAGGGYDVKLDRPGAPLYIQFKRSERMERRSAREYGVVRDIGGKLGIPFFRFPITIATKSDQHELLLALESPQNFVFYAAPRFHRIVEINAAWHASAVASRSVFVPPSAIGSLDDSQHTVAFDAASTWVCSAPRQINALTSRDLITQIQTRLNFDRRPLREKLHGLSHELRNAQDRARENVARKQREAAQRAESSKFSSKMAVDKFESVSSDLQDELAAIPPERPPILREPKKLPPEMQALREAADIAACDFDTQLIIVQPTRD